MNEPRRVWGCRFLAGLLIVLGSFSEPRAQEGPPSRTVSVTVDLERTAGAVTPFVYGQLIEQAYWSVHLGLCDQLIDNGGFELDADQAHRDVAQGWTIASTDPRNSFSGRLDDQNPRNGRFSQKITVSTFSGGEVRLLQQGLCVHRGVEYKGFASLRGNVGGSVRAVLLSDSGRELASQDLGATAGVDWRRAELALSPSDNCVDARFAIALGGSGELAVDHVRLAPSGAGQEQGTRSDLVSLYRRLSPAFIRWPGGTYLIWHHWKNGIGPLEDRPQTFGRRLSGKPQHDQEWDPNTFGTDEFLRFCAELGTEPMINVALKDGLENTLDWLEYCNGSPDTEWGSRRQKNGRRDPYAVKYWIIDNEPTHRSQEKGYDVARFPALARRWAEAMKKKDPRITVLIMGETGLVPHLDAVPEFSSTVVRESAAVLDGLCVHAYYNNALQGMPYRMGAAIATLKKSIDAACPGRDVKVAVTEWNPQDTTDQAGTMGQALEGAQWFHVLERSSAAGILNAAAPCQLAVNVGRYRGAWLRSALIQFNNHAAWVSPLYHVNELYARLRQPVLLDAAISDAPMRSAKAPKDFRFPAVDVVATRDPARRRVIVKMVHNGEDQDFLLRLDFRSLKGIQAARITEIRADSLGAMNTEALPEAVRPAERSIPAAGTTLEVRLKPHTVAALELDVE